MRPPQESPTRQAVSSATPNSSVLGAPEAITSSASSTTAPSTQPPETEPRKCPSSSIARCEPTGRGAEPQVSTTVAIATLRPASRHCSAAVRMSSSIISILPLLCQRNLPSPYERRGENRRSCRAQPAARIVGFGPFARQCAAEFGHAGQVVNGPELVDMRQHGANALRLRRKFIETEQRIDPDQPATRFVQTLHLGPQRLDAVALEPVGEQQHDRALPQHPA